MGNLAPLYILESFYLFKNHKSQCGSFFLVSHKGRPRSTNNVTIMNHHIHYFQKILKNDVSKMETQFVTIIYKFYCKVLLQYIRFFTNEVLKKKSKKELGPFSGTFIKNIFFLNYKNFMKKTLFYKN
jgi:3-phosphoglycerate kinase